MSLGLIVFAAAVFGQYDRAVTVSGRTEVIAIQGDGTDFSNWTLPNATLIQDLGGAAVAEPGAITLELARGASARFVRRGRGPLLVSFAARRDPAAPPPNGCTEGARAVGHFSLGEATAAVLCDGAAVRATVKLGDAPLVVSLRGAVSVGEEVRAGAGAQPLLLDGSAQLLVRHGWPFTWLCQISFLNRLCGRFVATRSDLSAGDTLDFQQAQRGAEATGFFRIDAEESAGGLRFDLAAADATLEVRRMKGDSFQLSESLFDRIANSPLLQMLNTTLATLALVWWFVRLPEKARTGSLPLLAALAALALPTPALAQQALLRAGDTGQALLRSRADRCYAVTPQHVLGGDTTGSLVLEHRALADADVLRLVPAAPEAMAVMITRAVPMDFCPAFALVPALDSLLRARSNGILRLVKPDGSFDRMPLVVLSVDVETFEVRPQDPGSVFAQGMSGGTVLIDDQPAGLLTDVREEGRVGRVARLDRVFERLEPYLGAGLAQSSTPPPPRSGVDTAAMTVARWTAEPVSPANRADALLGEGDQPWRVTDSVAAVVFKLGPERLVLTGVSVDAGGLADPPRSVEVLLGSSEAGPWRSIASFALEPGDGVRRASLPPTRAGFAMVRARDRQPGQATMGLRRFSLLVQVR